MKKRTYPRARITRSRVLGVIVPGWRVSVFEADGTLILSRVPLPTFEEAIQLATKVVEFERRTS